MHFNACPVVKYACYCSNIADRHFLLDTVSVIRVACQVCRASRLFPSMYSRRNKYGSDEMGSNPRLAPSAYIDLYVSGVVPKHICPVPASETMFSSTHSHINALLCTYEHSCKTLSLWYNFWPSHGSATKPRGDSEPVSLRRIPPSTCKAIDSLSLGTVRGMNYPRRTLPYVRRRIRSHPGCQSCH